MASHGNFRRGQAEQGKRRKISTLSGNVTIVHPIEAVGLGQAVIAVAGNKIYHMAGLWDRMTQEEAEGQYLVTSIKSNKALTFGRVRPEEQMADSSRVGAIGTHQPKREVCLQYKGTVPQFRKDGTIYQIDQRRNGEVADESIPRQLRGSVPPSTGISAVPTPSSLSVETCPSEYDFDPMEYTDLEDLAWQQEASAQPEEESGTAADRAAEEQLQNQQRQTHLWEETEDSTTPTGSPTSSVWQVGKTVEDEEPIVYEEHKRTTDLAVAEWIKHNQRNGGTNSVSSAATTVRRHTPEEHRGREVNTEEGRPQGKGGKHGKKS